MSTKKSKNTSPNTAKTDAQRVTDILSKASAEQVNAFLCKICLTHAEVREKLFSEFTQKKQSYSKAYFEGKMLGSMRESSRYSRYDDFELTHEVTDEAMDVLNLGDECLDAGDFHGAMNAAMAVLEQMSEAQEEYDDSYGHIGDSIEESMELLKTITSHPNLPADVRKELLDYYCHAFEQSKFAGWDEDLDMLALASVVAITPAEQARVLALCNRTCASEYTLMAQEVLVHEIIYNFRGEEAAEDYLQSHLSNRTFRKMAIETAIDNKDLAHAMALAEDGYQKANTPAGGPKGEWLEWKLAIAKKQKDKGQVLAFTRELFINRTGDTKERYAQLKKMIPVKDWKSYVEGLIQALKLMPYNAHHAIAEVYVAEGWLDRLIALVQQRNELGFTDTYKVPLSPRYNAELIEVYAGLFLKYIPRCSDRKAYQDAASYLKRIKTLEGGAEKVRELTAKVQRDYGNRPALLDEVRKV